MQIVQYASKYVKTKNPVDWLQLSIHTAVQVKLS